MYFSFSQLHQSGQEKTHHWQSYCSLCWILNRADAWKLIATVVNESQAQLSAWWHRRKPETASEKLSVVQEWWKMVFCFQQIAIFHEDFTCSNESNNPTWKTMCCKELDFFPKLILHLSFGSVRFLRAAKYFLLFCPESGLCRNSPWEAHIVQQTAGQLIWILCWY